MVNLLWRLAAPIVRHRRYPNEDRMARAAGQASVSRASAFASEVSVCAAFAAMRSMRCAALGGAPSSGSDESEALLSHTQWQRTQTSRFGSSETWEPLKVVKG